MWLEESSQRTPITTKATQQVLHCTPQSLSWKALCPLQALPWPAAAPGLAGPAAAWSSRQSLARSTQESWLLTVLEASTVSHQSALLAGPALAGPLDSLLPKSATSQSARDDLNRKTSDLPSLKETGKDLVGGGDPIGASSAKVGALCWSHSSAACMLQGPCTLLMWGDPIDSIFAQVTTTRVRYTYQLHVLPGACLCCQSEHQRCRNQHVSQGGVGRSLRHWHRLCRGEPPQYVTRAQTCRASLSLC